jgi:immune inhibitor A
MCRSHLADVLDVYRIAAATDDGQRCMVAPHPDLQKRLKQELAAIAERGGAAGVVGTMLRAAEPQRLGLNDGVIIPPEEFPLGTPPSRIRAAAADRAPLRGTLRVIVVLVDFSDQQSNPAFDRQHFEKLFFATGQADKSVRDYFQEVTNGLIDIQGEVVGPFRMPRTLAQYANGEAGVGDARPNAATMARDAAIAADGSVNFTPYDNDGNGFVDAFIVVHAGPGAEVTGNNGHIWSHKWVLDSGALNVDGTKIFAYLTVPEDAMIGVCCHELGHLLFGFPDLYDTDGSSEGVGDWCLMGGGSWGGSPPGSRPVHPSAWCKASQGWVTVDNRTTNATLSIPDVKQSRTVYRLWKNGAINPEYFLLENRQQAQFDASLPAGGLLVWHIDENISTNANESHYKVALVQADAQRDLENDANRGDAGDIYPGTADNRRFDNTSRPNSKSYSGVSTSVAVTNISGAGPVITARVKVRPGALAPPIAADAGRDRQRLSLAQLDRRIDAIESVIEKLEAMAGGESPQSRDEEPTLAAGDSPELPIKQLAGGTTGNGW